MSASLSANNTIFNDKSFVIKFVLLLVSIIIVSVLGILQNDDTFSFENSSFSSVKLDSIEKNLNGNSIDLNIVEDDFANLEELDLSNIELASIKKIDVNTPLPIKKNVVIKTPLESKKIESKKSDRVVITSGNVKSLSFIKKKFYATNNINFSLMISEKFLDKKRYKKALKWALISNEIDDKNENSWILFAKSKVKMGKKQDAINALQAYLKDNHSTNVKNLLDDIVKS
jgi:tetratricopeptide (TPR) repeat protein